MNWEERGEWGSGEGSWTKNCHHLNCDLLPHHYSVSVSVCECVCECVYVCVCVCVCV